MAYQIPLIIPCGADKEEKVKYTQHYHKENGKHTLLGYKLVDMQFNGKPFIQELVDRYKKSNFFDPIYIAGPKSVYKDCFDCILIDTDSNLGENIHKSLDHILKEHGSNVQCGISFGDIMPEVKDITKLMHEFKPYLTSDFIYEIVEKPKEMGNSEWKPGYTFIDEKGQKKKFLPGHLAIIKPKNLRLNLSYHLASWFYAAKNKSVGEKIVYSLSHINKLARHIIAVTEALPYTLIGYIKFSQRNLSIKDANRRFGHIVVSLPHRIKQKGPHFSVITTNILSFAKDIDTQEEYEEFINSQKTP